MTMRTTPFVAMLSAAMIYSATVPLEHTRLWAMIRR